MVKLGESSYDRSNFDGQKEALGPTGSRWLYLSGEATGAGPALPPWNAAWLLLDLRQLGLVSGPHGRD